MRRKASGSGLAVACALLIAGCCTNPADSEQQDEQELTIEGVWERLEDQDRWEFTEDDSLFLMRQAARSYCIWDWGTYEVQADSVTMAVHDGSCAGRWAISDQNDTLTLRLIAPCDSVTVFVRVSGPDHTHVPHCE